MPAAHVKEKHKFQITIEWYQALKYKLCLWGIAECRKFGLLVVSEKRCKYGCVCYGLCVLPRLGKVMQKYWSKMQTARFSQMIEGQFSCLLRSGVRDVIASCSICLPEYEAAI